MRRNRLTETARVAAERKTDPHAGEETLSRTRRKRQEAELPSKVMSTPEAVQKGTEELAAQETEHKAGSGRREESEESRPGWETQGFSSEKRPGEGSKALCRTVVLSTLSL